ncbi:hypothetical protein CAEBREN_26225 [Caenorhabditis brenneri]|uniref:Uncharacterized protein n=1 Tax=Caenorhabditis brenneri TaxID=135651 RepID=G0MQJ7_CAEBE|nr:hypothetical protein CAEBREN_26225 [Caenorhabditis brenneri]
MIHTQVLPHFT